jgi:hypothetical protein
MHPDLAVLRGVLPARQGPAIVDLSGDTCRVLAYAWLDQHCKSLAAAIAATTHSDLHAIVALLAPRCAEAVATCRSNPSTSELPSRWPLAAAWPALSPEAEAMDRALPPQLEIDEMLPSVVLKATDRKAIDSYASESAPRKQLQEMKLKATTSACFTFGMLLVCTYQTTLVRDVATAAPARLVDCSLQSVHCPRHHTRPFALAHTGPLASFRMGEHAGRVQRDPAAQPHADFGDHLGQPLRRGARRDRLARAAADATRTRCRRRSLCAVSQLPACCVRAEAAARRIAVVGAHLGG